MTPHTAPLPALLRALGADPRSGHTALRAEELLEKHGDNSLRGEARPGPLRRFVRQLGDVMVIILLVAAAISFAVALVEKNGEYIDAVIILAIVVLNGVLGVRQEGKAERALEALQDLSAPSAKTLRDGHVSVVPSQQLVPGDIVLLEAGDFVPADGRLLECAGLRCEESALTGESAPVEKDASGAVDRDAPLGERVNMVYSGCAVTYGRGVAVVTATGMQTEMGKIAGLLHGAGQKATPLQTRLQKLGRQLGIVAVAVCALIFALGILRGLEPLQLFLTVVSLAVAAIPEGLTAVVTVVLAIGVQRMVEKNAIVRSLPAVETLGSAGVICSDKTGTLTQNRMVVRRVWPAGGAAADLGDNLNRRSRQVLLMGSLCNDGHVDPGGDDTRAVGDPTETAILEAALQVGLDKAHLEEQYPRVAEVPFDSDRKRMSTVHLVNGKPLLIVKGGCDVVLPLCPRADQRCAEEVNRSMAEDALRVLAVACRELDDVPKNPDPDQLERELTFIGLMGMIDPPREESREAVALCRAAGIQTVMITGDHVLTASAIARDIGILREGGRAVSGVELAAMSDAQLAEAVEECRVYARVSPADKIRIVRAWQETGAVVAMTGDGVNDAPALKAADIGCAMGVTGTDVAKGAADMILTDDNFSTIVEAVRYGRGIYDNILKTVQFLLGSNLGEVFAVFAAMLLGWGAPLLAIHLLLVNVVTDALPALALGVEPIGDDVMRRGPLPRDRDIFSQGLGVRVVLQGLLVGTLTLVGYYVGCFVTVSTLFPPSRNTGMTVAFLVLALSQLAQALNCRSRDSLFRIGFASNPRMLLAVLGSAGVVTAIALVPPLERAFHMTDLSMAHWLLVAGLSVAPLFLVEAAKGALRLWAMYKSRREAGR